MAFDDKLSLQNLSCTDIEYHLNTLHNYANILSHIIEHIYLLYFLI